MQIRGSDWLHPGDKNEQGTSVCESKSEKQCDKIGLFQKDLGKKFSLKVAQIFCYVFGYFEKWHCPTLNCCGLFLGNYWKNWATFDFFENTFCGIL